MVDIMKVRVENNAYGPVTIGEYIASMTDAVLIDKSIIKFVDNVIWIPSVSKKL